MLFKDIYGFDPEVFNNGTAINIEDSYEDPRKRGYIISFSVRSEFDENISGNYLVIRCSVTELLVIKQNGKEFAIPADYFNGDKPRMKIRVLQ